MKRERGVRLSWVWLSESDLFVRLWKGDWLLLRPPWWNSWAVIQCHRKGRPCAPQTRRVNSLALLHGSMAQCSNTSLWPQFLRAKSFFHLRTSPRAISRDPEPACTVVCDLCTSGIGRWSPWLLAPPTDYEVAAEHRDMWASCLVGSQSSRSSQSQKNLHCSFTAPQLEPNPASLISVILTDDQDDPDLCVKKFGPLILLHPNLSSNICKLSPLPILGLILLSVTTVLHWCNVIDLNGVTPDIDQCRSEANQVY